jgi:hypothetical protein
MERSACLFLKEEMKPLASALLLVVAACHVGAAAANAQGPGPSMNKSLNYDGTYVGVSVVNNSKGNTWTSGGAQPCVPEPAPTLTITHGQARFPWQGYTLSGNVTPSGYLMMTSNFGQVFEGSINGQYQITGQVTGYCSYDLTFQKQS